MIVNKSIYYLTVSLSLLLIANTAIAAGTISGTVTCKRARDSRDTLVYIEKADGKFAPPEEHAVINQQNLTFVPHVLPVLAGTTVDFPNKDEVRHNVFSDTGSAKLFNLGISNAGVVKSILFDVVGETVLYCNVHAEMSGFIVSLQNPYYYLTDKSGAYTIKDVPPGKYTLTTWHEKLKPVSKKVEVSEGATVQEDFVLKKNK